LSAFKSYSVPLRWRAKCTMCSPYTGIGMCFQ
jgi:hypothetical protein